MSVPPVMRGHWVERIPGRLLRPLGLFPSSVTEHIFAVSCERVFATALAAGDLDFLCGRVLRIDVADAGIVLAVSSDKGHLVACNPSSAADVRISGDAYAFLLLASRREDADTLFFQRRLRIQGDTELGLRVKNFLDAWEPPPAVLRLQQLAARALERLSA